MENLQITPKGKLASIFGIKKLKMITQINSNIENALRKYNAAMIIKNKEIVLMCIDSGEGFNISTYDALYDMLLSNKAKKSTNRIISDFKEYMINNNVCICSQNNKLVFAPQS